MDGDGLLTFSVGIDVSTVDVSVDGTTLEFCLNVGNLDPSDTDTGLASRLRHMGHLGDEDEHVAARPWLCNSSRRRRRSEPRGRRLPHGRKGYPHRRRQRRLLLAARSKTSTVASAGRPRAQRRSRRASRLSSRARRGRSAGQPSKGRHGAPGARETIFNARASRSRPFARRSARWSPRRGPRACRGRAPGNGRRPPEGARVAGTDRRERAQRG